VELEKLLTKMQKVYEPHIDALRAVAIVGVLMHHFEIAFTNGGFLGVDVFFVISGYLISRNIISERSNGEWRFGSFYMRRVRRLLPAYLTTIFVTLLLGFLLLPVQLFNTLGGNALFALFHISNLNLPPILGYLDMLQGANPLLHLWSLNVEEQIYLVWPLIVVASLFLGRSFLPVIVVLFGSASLMIAHHYSGTGIGSPRAFFYMEARLFVFFLGALVLWIPVAKQIENSGYKILYTCIALVGVVIIFGAYIFPMKIDTPFNVLPACAGAMLVIYAGKYASLEFLFRNRLLVGIGLISYSLYLVHWPIYIYLKFWLYTPTGSQLPLQLGSLLLSAVFAFILYKTVETRYRSRIGTVSSVFSRRALVFCATTLVFSSAFAVYAKHESYDSFRISPPEGVLVSEPRMPGITEADCDKYYNHLQCDFLGRDGDGIDILVIGDSHQIHIWSLYRTLARELQLNIAFWAIYDCPPMFWTQTVRRDGLVREPVCDKLNGKWLRHIQAANPPMVIMAGSWYRRTESFNAYGTYGLKYDAPSSVPRRFYNPRSPALGPRKTFAQRIAVSTDLVLKSSRHVLLVSPVPPLGALPRDCYLIPKYLLSHQSQIKRCQQVSFEQTADKFSYIDRVLQRVAEARPAVDYVLLSDIFCSAKRRECRWLDDAGRIAYADEIHLSDEGMAFVVSKVKGQLAQKIRRSGVFDIKAGL
jgi:peptidoglycan/LPS O-acetylase OafA/YrhL